MKHALAIGERRNVKRRVLWSRYRGSYLEVQTCNFIKRETRAKEFSCDLCKNFENTFFLEHFGDCFFRYILTIIYCIRRVAFQKKFFLNNCYSVSLFLIAKCTIFSKGKYSFFGILCRKLKLLGIIQLIFYVDKKILTS